MNRKLARGQTTGVLVSSAWRSLQLRHYPLDENAPRKEDQRHLGTLGNQTLAAPKVCRGRRCVCSTLIWHVAPRHGNSCKGTSAREMIVPRNWVGNCHSSNVSHSGPLGHRRSPCNPSRSQAL